MKNISKTSLKFLSILSLASIMSTALFAGPGRFIKNNAKGNYVGLTDEAKKLIKDTRKILKNREDVFNKKFKQFESIRHAGEVNRLARGNVFMYGPPGGAKSLFVQWLFKNENCPSCAFSDAKHIVAIHPLLGPGPIWFDPPKKIKIPLTFKVPHKYEYK